MADRKTVKDEAPPIHDAGQFVAVCCDVIDLGLNVEQFQGQPPEIKDKTALVFLTVSEDGTEVRQISQEFTTSMGKKSNMRKFLEGWRGKPYSEEEAKKGVPLDKLEGVPALINVAHRTSLKGNEYAFIQTIGPLPKAMKDTVPGIASYQRPEFWEKRKAEYRANVEKHNGTNGHGAKAQGGAQDFADYPVGVVDDDDSSLPF